MNPRPKGTRANNWQGGSHVWCRMEVKKRDENTCQICGLRDPDVMQVDHIVPKAINPSLQFDITNMVTLCANCHMRKTMRERRMQFYSKNKKR